MERMKICSEPETFGNGNKGINKDYNNNDNKGNNNFKNDNNNPSVQRLTATVGEPWETIDLKHIANNNINNVKGREVLRASGHKSSSQPLSEQHVKVLACAALPRWPGQQSAAFRQGKPLQGILDARTVCTALPKSIGQQAATEDFITISNEQLARSHVNGNGSNTYSAHERSHQVAEFPQFDTDSICRSVGGFAISRDGRVDNRIIRVHNVARHLLFHPFKSHGSPSIQNLTNVRITEDIHGQWGTVSNGW